MQFLGGLLGPIFGVLIVKSLFAMIIYQFDSRKMREEVDYWVLMMVIGACAALIIYFVAKYAFGIVGENITLNVR